MSNLVTVCILTYNPDWIKYRNTLRSIICQKDIDFNIVISDDGSKINHFDMVDEFFKENNFTAYKLISNEKNQGTVKNVIYALQHIDRKYVKLISPGDFLYNETVLAQFTEYAEKNKGAAYFGNMIFYSINDNKEIKIHENLCNPKNLHPWINNDYMGIRRNYLILRDYIIGANSFYQRESLIKYVKKFDGEVKYAEDLCMMWMIAAREKVLYFPIPFVFYEFGSGISTNSSTEWSKKINEDVNQAVRLMYMNKDISWIEYMSFCSKNRLLRIFFRTILFPLYIFRQLNTPKNNSVTENKEIISYHIEQILNPT